MRPPVLKTRLNASRFDASQYGKACVQPVRSVFNTKYIYSLIFFQGRDSSTLSEDCLSINVHRPKGLKSSAKFPVVSFTSHVPGIHSKIDLAVVLDVRILGYAYVESSRLIG